MLRGETLTKAATWAGRLIAAAAVVFLIVGARRHWGALSSWRLTPGSGALILTASIAYGAGMMLVAESWHQIVGGVTRRRVSRFVTWPSFGVTQIAKYLPGNVLHYVGRHFWLKKQGISHREALTAGAWEVVLLTASALGAAAIVLAAFPLALALFSAGEVKRLALAVLGVLLLCLTIAVFARRLAAVVGKHIPSQLNLVLSPLALVGFFGLQGGIFYLLFATVGAHPPVGVMAIAMLAWLLGYLTPGAPGGIGSREAVLVALTTAGIGSADALILAGLFRVVTTLGDLVCFGISTMVARLNPIETPTAA